MHKINTGSDIEYWRETVGIQCGAHISILNYADSTLLYSKARDSLEGCHLFVAGEDTEHQRYKGQQGHAEPEVGHIVLSLGLGQSVSQC